MSLRQPTMKLCQRLGVSYRQVHTGEIKLRTILRHRSLYILALFAVEKKIYIYISELLHYLSTFLL